MTEKPGHHDARTRAAAGAVRDGFAAHQDRFRDLTRRAPGRHAARDWTGMQRDGQERLALYEAEANRTAARLAAALGDHVECRACWAATKRAYAEQLAGRPDVELGQSFFSSISRRLLTTVGVEPAVEFAGADFEPAGGGPVGEAVYTTHAHAGDSAAVARAILATHPAGAPYRDLDGDAARIGAAIDAYRATAWGGQAIEAVDVLDAAFYRNKGVYLMGRIRGGRRLMPLVIALVNDDGRAVVDAVLLTVDEASIVWSFTRAAFHADVPAPARVVRFLKSIMPAKRVAELYSALGYFKHGKAELYRDVMAYLDRSAESFDIAPGDRGMVMVVFTLPSYDVVFKVIRDAFEYPKSTTRRHVMDRYRLVFRHDRAGRLVDAQEFEHLVLPRARFTERLLAELGESAAQSVAVDGDRVAIRHLYAERRVTPLNLYLREAPAPAAREAVLDFGQAIKDLAATNIFPGDLLLKNFGVTRHGRVIFYDYDELTLLTECAFRTMPEPRDLEEEMAAEPWFYVGPHDIFPEELGRFMGLYGPLRDAFREAHGDLLDTAFWQRMQRLHEAGEVVDIFPYRAARRVRPA